MADGWFSSGNPTFTRAVRPRDRLAELYAEGGRPAPLPVHVRMAGADHELDRYRENRFAHVTVWPNQLWPAEARWSTSRSASPRRPPR